MKIRVFVLLASALTVSSCGTLTVPAAVRMDTGETLIGTATAAMDGGKFSVKSPSGSQTCSGTYDPFDNRPTISAPFNCSGGEFGTMTVTRNADMRSGSGTVTLSNGTSGRVAFGSSAASVIASPPQPSTYQAQSLLPKPAAPSTFRRYYRGPRGGCYYLTSGGNKQYVDRSLCN